MRRRRGFLLSSLALVLLAGGTAVAGPELEKEGTSGHGGRLLGKKPDLDAIRKDLDAYGYDTKDFEPVPDRWRIQLPRWDRYGVPSEKNRVFDIPFSLGNLWNPYRQNVLKGDYPIIGQNTFLNIQVLSDTVIEHRDLPTPSAISTAAPRRQEFFGGGDQFFVTSNLGVTLEMFHGNTAFKPPDYIVRVTGVANVSYLDIQENNGVNIDVREETTRTDGHFGLQEAFFEKHLVDLSPNYDFLSVTVGIQSFVSDFRGLLFFDNNLGARATVNLDNNRTQMNAAVFFMLEKDTNSELNRFDARDQYVVILNFFRQDFLFFGYTISASFHFNRDLATAHTDANKFPARPSVLGAVVPHELDVYYLGIAGDGHIGRLNLTHEYFFAFGEDSFNQLAQRAVDIEAHMFFLELSVDFDWLRVRASFLWASGDENPFDDTARGFDSILDNPNFAGGINSFWIRQSVRILGVGLVQRLSTFPNLRSSKLEGQANFVNPGLFFLTFGLDADLTAELRTTLNFSYLFFDSPEALESFVNQDDLDAGLGFEITLGAQYRPFVTNNVQVSAGVSVFFPGEGYEDLYETSQVQGSFFLQLTLIY